MVGLSMVSPPESRTLVCVQTLFQSESSFLWFGQFLFMYSVEFQEKTRDYTLATFTSIYDKDVFPRVHRPFSNIFSLVSLNVNLNIAPSVSLFFLATLLAMQQLCNCLPEPRICMLSLQVSRFFPVTWKNSLISGLRLLYIFISPFGYLPE